MDDWKAKPTNIRDLKRLAKVLKNEKGIKHTDALHEAAIRAGFNNYAQAQAALPEDSPKSQNAT